MRRLLYLPIMHEAVDLGGAGATLAHSSSARAGADRWERHEEIVRRFWEEAEAYLRSLDPRQLTLYQDGLPVGGEIGRRVVEEAARRASRNYQLLLALLVAGARLVATEDPELLLEERARILDPELSADPGAGERLLERRDAFIADTIDDTLGEDEIGVLFVGAQHEVAPRLAPDIAVQMLKDPGMIREYVWMVVAREGAARDLDALATYVAAPVGQTRPE